MNRRNHRAWLAVVALTLIFGMAAWVPPATARQASYGAHLGRGPVGHPMHRYRSARYYPGYYPYEEEFYPPVVRAQPEAPPAATYRPTPMVIEMPRQ